MLLLHNAKFHTLDPQQPTATALVVEQRLENSGHVLARGDVETLKQEFPKAELEDLGGGAHSDDGRW